MSTQDYKSTVVLPQTAFPMKGRLPEREPQWLQFWQDMDLQKHRRACRAGATPFVLHDGPPYANGHLHIGHALNKILKDIINRGYFMLGHDVVYRPGWDCHGLPIEWKVEEEYRAQGRDKDSVPVLEFRHRCREFATHWVDIQRAEFIRLGVAADWQNAYTTMDFASEAAILQELGRFLLNDGLIAGERPVMWSVAEKTALAEAEVEYRDHVSTTVTVRFPVLKSPQHVLEGAHIVIWTTTPWTLPGNRAVAYGEDIDYGVYRVESCDGTSRAVIGERIVCARALWPRVAAEAGIDGSELVGSLTGRDLAGTLCRHPLYNPASHNQGYDVSVPLLAGSHVTVEVGTGFVHIAPGHGVDDFMLGRANGLDIPPTIDDGGLFLPHVPLFAGQHVFKVDPVMVEALAGAGHLLSRASLTHSYPHSWRSRAPLIFRTTPQWFISMAANDLRAKSVREIDSVRWVPATERNRMHSMVASRPDWCVSRQRVWGVPLAIFVESETGAVLRDAAVMARVSDAVAASGADVWFEGDPRRFLGPDHDSKRYRAVKDILDVWFDSGSTHAFVLEPEGTWPADLYLEGSDQHRGWFQSSLLESCGTRGQAPYKTVLTHGFVLDERGRKMSKSLGNVVAPQDITRSVGADILRLWVATSDYGGDLRIGPDILKAQTDTYRKIRNSLRFILGNLGPGTPTRPDAADMPELERWVLHRLWELDATLRRAYRDYTPHVFFNALRVFCISDLSAFYFDIRKDCFYCDGADNPRRGAAMWVLARLFDALSAWLAPVLCFTMEEAWQTRREEDGNSQAMAPSVHLRAFPDIPASWRDDALAERWENLRNVRRVITGAVELERAEKRLGSSLQACPQIYVTPDMVKIVEGVDWAELAITSDARLVVEDPPPDAFSIDGIGGVKVRVERAKGGKCARCWKLCPEVAGGDGDDLCHRCQAAVAALPETTLPETTLPGTAS